jgi:hypothetical protein
VRKSVRKCGNVFPSPRLNTKDHIEDMALNCFVVNKKGGSWQRIRPPYPPWTGKRIALLELEGRAISGGSLSTPRHSAQRIVTDVIGRQSI